MKTLVVAPSERQLEMLVAALTDLGPITEVSGFVGSLAGQAVLPVKGDIDFLVIDAGDEPSALLDDLERLLPLYPQLSTVLLAPQNSADLLLRALRTGVREVLRPNAARDELFGALTRITQRQRVANSSRGEVMAFISCKGGSGSTFLATNVGYALASNLNKKVLVIDLNLQFGDAALFVCDRRPVATLSEVVQGIDALDASLLQSSVVEVMPNFAVLASPEDPTRAPEVLPEHVENIVRFARTIADLVILDLGRTIDPVTLRALDLADHIYPVMQLALPYFRDGKRLNDLFRSLGYARAKIRTIVNRVQKNSELTVADLEKALGIEVFATVENDYASVAASVNQGVPVLKLRPTSLASKSISSLCATMFPSEQVPRANWFSRLRLRTNG